MDKLIPLARTFLYRFLNTRNVTCYTRVLIKSFKHSGLEKFFKEGSKAGIQPAHARKLQLQLAALNAATQPADMNAPGWDLHPLKSKLVHHFSVSVSGNWRLTFRFEGQDATIVDYQDYH